MARKLKYFFFQEFVGNPVLFSDGTTRFDIGQRNPQTCWFLAMLANLSEDQEFFRRVLTDDSYYTSPDRYDGIFHCKLWKFGQWRDVYTDDYLPVGIDRNKRLYIWTSHSATDNNEMWVSLMEKAFARFHGSYDEVYGGQPGDAYLALTGGVSERIVFEDHRIEPIKLFHRIRNALRTGALVSCGVWVRHAVLKLYFRNTGRLISMISTMFQVETRHGDRVCLLRVRNPWGRVEWRGDWSDTSRKWDDLIDGARIPDHAEDGEFWISIGDFLRYFFQLTICSITPDVDVDGRRDDLSEYISYEKVL
ncbi:hypothetical protein LOTGIDRAFT_102635 [Lottia gigantea]|uniref:Calpain catalytic domain-containing protein n=1 Tax=Lottia gigantea TaxID=225164 RepID=V4AN77_LOTGI|nr:hypothetical protein LOTGIDRAFT_102635 [Lottia gigantea]ESP05624.1 hypothetical protein LOTGIDRAFT_102635 [Lottia gigantea]